MRNLYPRLSSITALTLINVVVTETRRMVGGIDNSRGLTMDLAYVTLMILFFALLAGLAAGCDKLGGGK